MVGEAGLSTNKLTLVFFDKPCLLLNLWIFSKSYSTLALAAVWKAEKAEKANLLCYYVHQSPLLHHWLAILWLFRSSSITNLFDLVHRTSFLELPTSAIVKPKKLCEVNDYHTRTSSMVICLKTIVQLECLLTLLTCVCLVISEFQRYGINRKMRRIFPMRGFISQF